MQNNEMALDLKGLNVQELNEEEAQNIDGGLAPFLLYGSYLAAGTGAVTVGYKAGKWLYDTFG
jgi:lactobin A/cerein 7B family class IIb bacteriocin